MNNLLITGDRLRGHHKVELDGSVVWLSSTGFHVLCRLVVARKCTETGYAAGDDLITPISIFRLRKILGHSAVETGCCAEYRLALLPEKINIDPSILELPRGVLDIALADQLAKLVQTEVDAN